MIPHARTHARPRVMHHTQSAGGPLPVPLPPIFQQKFVCLSLSPTLTRVPTDRDCIYQNADERGKDFEEGDHATAHQAPQQRQIRFILVMLHRLVSCHHRAGLGWTDCLDKKESISLKDWKRFRNKSCRFLSHICVCIATAYSATLVEI